MINGLKLSLRHLPELGKYGLVLLTIVFISFLFPDSIRFKYEFEQGQTWRYSDLRAPFDFPIKKPEAEILAEQERIKADFSPYYSLDPEVARRQKRIFEEQFRAQLNEVQGTGQFNDVVRNARNYLQYGNQLLDRLYSQGIIRLAPQHQDKSKDFVINVVRGNSTQKQTVQNILDVEAARELITDSLPYSKLYEAEFLLPILPDLIFPNLTIDDSLTNRFLTESLEGIVTSSGMVRQGELIVSQGGAITDEVYQELLSFRDQYLQQVSGEQSYWVIFSGYFLLTSIIIGVFILYLRLYSAPIFQKYRQLIFLLLWMVAYSYLVYAVEKTEALSVYIIPFCIVPIVIKIFYTDRLAFCIHIVVILLASFLTSLGYEFTLLQILAGIVAIMSNPDARDWSKFFKSMVYIYLTYALTFLGLSLIQEGGLSSDDGYYYVWIFLNVFLTLLSYPLIPLLERVFGFTSSITLVELSDMNRPLLRELALKAPGTLQHSLQVANLSEAAADAIGADQLLVKVAALYHDVGKSLRPEFFIENQSGPNPHEGLPYLESASIIIDHVHEGVRLARRYRLPKVLIDFIRTHHGTTRVEYFYRNYVQENPGTEFDDQIFRYPGPKPTTKEETILMMADSLEAASKSLKNPTGQDIDELVDKIIGGKISQGQLEGSEMTFEELEKCKTVFRQRLRSINHVRVEYPAEQD